MEIKTKIDKSYRLAIPKKVIEQTIISNDVIINYDIGKPYLMIRPMEDNTIIQKIKDRLKNEQISDSEQKFLNELLNDLLK